MSSSSLLATAASTKYFDELLSYYETSKNVQRDIDLTTMFVEHDLNDALQDKGEGTGIAHACILQTRDAVRNYMKKEDHSGSDLEEFLTMITVAARLGITLGLITVAEKALNCKGQYGLSYGTFKEYGALAEMHISRPGDELVHVLNIDDVWILFKLPTEVIMKIIECSDINPILSATFSQTLPTHVDSSFWAEVDGQEETLPNKSYNNFKDIYKGLVEWSNQVKGLTLVDRIDP